MRRRSEEFAEPSDFEVDKSISDRDDDGSREPKVELIAVNTEKEGVEWILTTVAMEIDRILLVDCDRLGTFRPADTAGRRRVQLSLAYVGSLKYKASDSVLE